MPLIKSVSGIRGTIGGSPGDNLTPVDIVNFVSAYGQWLREQHETPVSVVVGRDGRISGNHVQRLVTESLRSMGIHVVDVGLSTTPTVEMYVIKAGAQGGIVITASHNPKEWNALKFLNQRGEFISAEAGQKILDTAAARKFTYASLADMGKVRNISDAIDYHVQQICALDLVPADLIQQQGFHVVVDCINSTGAFALPKLLEALDCGYTLINEEVSGNFAHNPEPLDAHLGTLKEKVVREKADLGIAVDPDVDRLALVCGDGSYFGEEYTLVAVADYILGKTPGSTVSNMSSSLALKDITLRHGQKYSSSPVGEVHVVTEMKKADAVIGGEGNGGVIFPALHYGRDALVGIALVLAYMAESGKSLAELRLEYPSYHMAKHKIELGTGVSPEVLVERVLEHFTGVDVDRRDGVKLSFEDSWIHLRLSNTEPIIRVYVESPSREHTDRLVEEVMAVVGPGPEDVA